MFHGPRWPGFSGVWQCCCRCNVLYCYAVTRRDLSFPQQAVQAAHACIEAARFGLISPDISPPHLILCYVASEEKLRALARELDARGISLATFCEPDLSGQLTALCTRPVSGAERTHFRKLQLLKPQHAESPRPM